MRVTGKYLWCFFITEISTSRGSSRYSAGKPPMTAVGISTRLATSASSPASMMAWPLTRSAACFTCSTIRALRSSLSMTMPASRITSKYLSAEGTVISGESYGRRPRVTFPAVTPAYSNGMTLSPNIATNQRIGREKATPELFQRMDLVKLMPATNPGRASASTSGAGRPV